jgi:hypothetical protein
VILWVIKIKLNKVIKVEAKQLLRLIKKKNYKKREDSLICKMYKNKEELLIYKMLNNSNNNYNNN